MAGIAAGMRRLVGVVEQWDWLDGFSEKASGLIGRATESTAVKNCLSGTWLGHSLHPILTDVPIGSWAAASFLDLTAGEKSADAAQRLVGLGVLAVVPTAATGASDWADTYGEDQRVGVAHAAGNVAATLIQVLSLIARSGGHRRTGAVLSLAALGVAGGSAYLGGHLTLGRGVGVNHTAFEEPGDAWTDVAAQADLADGSLTRVDVDGVAVVLAHHDGRLDALSATCTHAGGPLDEGTLSDGCIVCPWHGSRFRLDDGDVERGPATVPQPHWEVKISDGRVLVRPSAR